MNLNRIIPVFIGQTIVMIIFLIMAYNINKNKERQSIARKCFTGYYLGAPIGIIINFFYVLIHIEHFSTFLYLLCIFFIYQCPIFMYSAVISIRKKNLKKRELYISILIFEIVLSIIFLIPNGITMNDSTNWYPLPSLFFLIYSSIVLNIPTILMYINAVLIVKSDMMRNEKEIKRKWALIIIGTVFSASYVVITMIVHYINNDSLRTIWSILGFLIAVIASYISYSGIQKKLKK